MSYCINPRCPKPVDPANAKNRICRNCGSDILLQGRYRVITLLGSGGFGQTFEVDDSGTAKVVKVLKVLTENNSKAIELFQQEAKVLSRLNNTGIPKVDSDGYFTVLPKNSSVPLHCLVMEKIEGVDLEKWMESNTYQPISQPQALNWLKQLVEILNLVHTHQYFHRDIKPQNIMLRPSGQLVLIDFGAVREVTTTILKGNSHTRIISQGYSPPEQQNGYSVQQSDFFALGRTFIFLLTGKEPQDKAIYDPLTNELNWRHYAVNISPLFTDLIDYLIAPTANQRPENTIVILQRLNEIEKALKQPHFLVNTAKNQSNNNSPSFLITVSLSRSQPVNNAAKLTHKKLKNLHWFISLGVGCFAIATLKQPKNKHIVAPEDKIPVITIPESAPKAKSRIQPDPVNVTASKDLEAQQGQREEIEQQKRLAALKAEQDRQKAIKIEKAAKEAQENLEAVIKEGQTYILKQQKEQDALKKQQQTKKQAEKFQPILVTKQQKTTVVISNKRELSPKSKVERKKQEKAGSSNDYVNDANNPWESTYPTPKAYDELEQVIKEGN
ncbi:serine/threonine protein kinase [Nostoc sp. T09]|uniref:serine/threonine-protein kinase n=1 Tax=Nostoc sp. T09 TaxID=1932621 RepID=UPI000B66C34A|nr:serine/threonine-protein kinase [Nostoc sp. T09]OUL37549.1 serine/threonine protein kinase [Nostoc sp. T09]